MKIENEENDLDPGTYQKHLSPNQVVVFWTNLDKSKLNWKFQTVVLKHIGERSFRLKKRNKFLPESYFY